MEFIIVLALILVIAAIAAAVAISRKREKPDTGMDPAWSVVHSVRALAFSRNPDSVQAKGPLTKQVYRFEVDGLRVMYSVSLDGAQCTERFLLAYDGMVVFDAAYNPKALKPFDVRSHCQQSLAKAIATLQKGERACQH